MQVLNTKTITVRGKLNAKGKLYKKVSNEMLIQAIEKDFGFKPAADMLKFDKNIKEEGLFDIVINLGFDQVAQAKIKVTGQKDSE
jgi:ribosomal protein L9